MAGLSLQSPHPVTGPAEGGAMAGVTGLEPAASGVTGRRSIHLSYTPKWTQGPFSGRVGVIQGR